MLFELGHRTNNHLPENMALGVHPSKGAKTESEQGFIFGIKLTSAHLFLCLFLEDMIHYE